MLSFPPLCLSSVHVSSPDVRLLSGRMAGWLARRQMGESNKLAQKSNELKFK